MRAGKVLFLTIGMLVSLAASAQKGAASEPASQIIRFTAAEALKADDAATILASRLELNAATDELRSVFIQQPGDGLQVERFNQYFKGIPVVHGSFSLSSKEGRAAYAFGKFYHLPANTAIVPQVSEGDALAAALANTGAQQYLWQAEHTAAPKGELTFVEDFSGTAPDGMPHLAYVFDIYALEPLSRDRVYVDAQSGKILLRDAIIQHVAAKGKSLYSDTVQFEARKMSNNFYYLHDTTRGKGVFTYNLNHATSFTAPKQDSSSATFWTVASDPGVDAHWGASRVYDFWKTNFNRLSWNGKDSSLRSYVHYGNAYNNAFWNGTVMSYGDGSGSASGGFDPLTSLDVCGHEIGHGVCASTAALVYQGESGGMNEGFSDIWGACIENWANPREVDAKAKDPWLIGEEISQSPLRSMRQPKLYDQPNTYGGDFWIYAGPGCATSNDNCGVHTNSGVLNYWFYLLCDGGHGTNDLGTGFGVKGIGMTKGAKIAFATELALNSTANYASARLASIAAANTLYGACSPEVEAVTRAWYGVGVGANYTPCTTEISFGDVVNNVTEDAGVNACPASHTVSIPVTLNGPALAGGPATVTASVIGGTAVAGVDYNAPSLTATFTVGGATTQNINFTAYDNGVVSADKYIDLVFTLNAGASNAIKASALDTTRVYLNNNDRLPDDGGIDTRTVLLNNVTGNTSSPFYSGAKAAHSQFIYRAAELKAAGVRAGIPISAADFYIVTKVSTQPFSGFTMRMAHTPQVSLAGGFLTPTFTTVYSANLTTTAGLNTLAFSTPFVWNGTDNIVVEFCFTNTTNNTSNDRVQAQTGGSYYLAGTAYSNTSTSGCTLPLTTNYLSARPVIRLTQDIPATQIQSATSGSRIWNVPVGQQTFFYSSDSGKLIGTVSNPAITPGCVTMGVAKSGNGFVLTSGGAMRSVKEFSITPTASGVDTTFDASFYLSNAELAGYDPNSLRILQTTAATDAQMTASNTEIVTATALTSPQFTGFIGSFHHYGRFYLISGNIALGTATVNAANGAVWTGENPFKDVPVLHWSLGTAERASIRLYDVTGKTIWTAEQTLGAGSHSLKLGPGADFAPGTYLLQVVRASGVVTSKLVKE